MLIVSSTLQLVCLGVQTFSRNGELLEERSGLKHESWSTSRGRESYAATGLLPNCRYTCRLLSVARDRESDGDRSPQVTFHTNPGSKFYTYFTTSQPITMRFMLVTQDLLVHRHPASP